MIRNLSEIRTISFYIFFFNVVKVIYYCIVLLYYYIILLHLFHEGKDKVNMT